MQIVFFIVALYKGMEEVAAKNSISAAKRAYFSSITCENFSTTQWYMVQHLQGAYFTGITRAKREITVATRSIFQRHNLIKKSNNNS